MALTGTIDSIFVGKNSLLDTKLKEVLLNTDKLGELEIKLTFINFKSESDFDRVEVLFQNVEEFSFYYNKDYIFYYVADYKLLNFEGKIYLSLDPDESTTARSHNDCNFILSEKATIVTSQ